MDYNMLAYSLCVCVCVCVCMHMCMCTHLCCVCVCGMVVIRDGTIQGTGVSMHHAKSIIIP